MVNVKVVNEGIFDLERGGGGGPKFGLERTVELWRGQITSDREDHVFLNLGTPVAVTSPREILLCEERRTDNRRVLKNNILHF